MNQSSWLHNNIFHTRVEYQGKALNFIIDNGSDINVISQKIVDTLKLYVEAQPTSYKLS